MFKVLDRGFIRTQLWLADLKESFQSDERGVSGIVAALILVLLAILLAVFFWKQISELAKNLWGQISGKAKFDEIK